MSLLKTRYLGLDLPHPFMIGASPMADDLDSIRRCEDAGASALVMRSLFAEQIESNRIGYQEHIESHGESFSEAGSYFPSAIGEAVLGPDTYLDQISQAKAAVGMPIIGSLNGFGAGAWTRYAGLIEEAGADALELNLYYLASDPDISAEKIEIDCIRTVEAVKEMISIPLAVKISATYTSIARFAGKLSAAGADSIVLFNRFYQPDIDVENLQVVPTLRLSTTSELLLRLRWLALLYGRVDTELSASGGVGNGIDAIKALMTGATTVQVVSAVLRHGPSAITQIQKEASLWMEDHEYASVDELRGCMSHRRASNPDGIERANYMQILHSWRP